MKRIVATGFAFRTPRLVFIDNLRWSAISMVVVIHAAVTYSGLGSWYVRDVSGTSRALAVALGTYQSFQHSVAMGLLFGIAGYFAHAAVEAKGPRGFLRERLFRLGLPLVAYVLLIEPVTQYFIAGNWRGSFVQAWWRYMTDGRVLAGSGPLWFCLVLLALSFCYVALRQTGASADVAPRPVPGVPQVLGYAGLMAAAAFVTGLVVPANTTVLNVVVHDFPQYPMMFAVGIWAHRNDWLLRWPSRAGRMWGIVGLLGGAAAWCVLIAAGGALRGHLGDYYGGWHWQAAGMDAWRAVMCVSLTLGLVTLYRDRFGRQGPFGRFLTRNAFGVYVFHAPILIAVTQILRHWPIDAALKFGVASAVAVTATFLFVGLVARRIPGVQAIL